MKARLLVASGVLVVGRLAAGQFLSKGTPEASARLQAFVERYEGMAGDQGQYDATFVRLHNGGGLQAIVYLRGQGWCGNGGCTMLVLDDEGQNFRVVAHVTVVHEPIRVLPTSSHGWSDLGVMVQGGGILKAYEARLRSDGKRYPGNPTVAPAERLSRVAGIVVLPTR